MCLHTAFLSEDQLQQLCTEENISMKKPKRSQKKEGRLRALRRRVQYYLEVKIEIKFESQIQKVREEFRKRISGKECLVEIARIGSDVFFEKYGFTIFEMSEHTMALYDEEVAVTLEVLLTLLGKKLFQNARDTDLCFESRTRKYYLFAGNPVSVCFAVIVHIVYV